MQLGRRVMGRPHRSPVRRRVIYRTTNHTGASKVNTVNIVWATPDIDHKISEMARVSNPANQKNPDIAGLLNFMMREGHVSPFEMANMCVEINTTRDIGRQILRHRSFSFQEFSQRYQVTDELPPVEMRECRMQDQRNRQSSVKCVDGDINDWWRDAQQGVSDLARTAYHNALALGIAKEQARALLPEGLTPSRMYMNGTIRSWIHYLQSRLHASTQQEHRELAQQVLALLRTVAPVTAAAFFVGA
jgi:thymidylate synthase (FAD)